MKKSLLALVVLGSFAGAASAASSVTLWGKVDVAYTNVLHDTYKTKMHGGGESRIGINVNEDLGNGMAAFANLEAGFDGSTGAVGSTFFNEQSKVGLSFGNGMHKVYFGGTNSPMDRIGKSTDHRSSGLGWKSSEGHWNNAAFYEYNGNGLTVVTGITTKSGLAGNTGEGTSGKSSYGISANYAASNWSLAAGYQADNATIKNEFGVGASYTFNPVTVAASYADAKYNAGGKVRRMHATVSAMVTANDKVFVNYINAKNKGIAPAGKLNQIGLGYVHSLSKRTEVFANAGFGKGTGAFAGQQGSVNANGKYRAWDIGLRHSF